VSGDHAVERPGRDDREPEAAGPRRAAQHAHRGLWLTQGCLVTALTLVLVAAQAEPYRAYLTAAVAALIVAIGTTFSVRRTVRSDAGQTGARDIEAVEGGAATDAVTHRSEERFRALVQHSSDVILVLDASGVVRYHSPSLRDVLGDRAALVLGRLPLDVVAASHRQRVREAFERCRDAPDGPVVVDLPLAPPPDDRYRPPDTFFEITLTNMLDDDVVGGIVVNGHDVTDRTVRARELERLAFHDSVTGLPNRIALERRLDELTTRHASAAVLVVDLDRFKAVNDALRDVSPEHVLRVVGLRLKDLVGDQATVANLGGDEFVILIEGMADAERAVGVGRDVLDMLRRTLRVGVQQLALTASIGVSAGRSDRVRGHELLRRADSAMHQAKEHGGDRLMVFDEQRQRRRSEHSAIADALARALEHDELDAYYQPWIATATRRIAGAEALLRWRREGRLVSPTTFVPVAESSGLIVDLGAWVLDRACRDLSWWQSVHGSAAPSISVNVSARQLRDPDFVRRVEDIIVHRQVDPEGLIIELTESALVDDPAAAQRALGDLKALGARVAIDDFGTGYSSLAYLMDMAADVVKVDRAFVVEVTTNPRAEQLLRAVVDLAHGLGMSVTVEGVETAEQFEVVSAAGL
jgi:diguanylate cyclase (GGDEF)-like protein/PAS domain S-box-containing protein